VPGDAVLVIRGDELDASLIMEDATRFFERFADWGRFGISAFHAASEDEVDVLCQTRLIRFATVVVFRWKDLVASGVQVVPTFRTPHVTLCHEQLDELVARLLGCEHRTLDNPYTVTDEEGDP
jgi:hypothetical protein